MNIFLPESDSEAAAADLVERVLDALHADPVTRAALEAAAGGAPAGTPRYRSLPKLQGLAPPAGLPFYIPDIRMLEVPAPAQGGEAAVTAAVSGVAGGITVEASVPVHGLQATEPPPRSVGEGRNRNPE